MGHTIVGVDAAAKAAEEFYEEHNMEFTMEQCGKAKLYKVYFV